jgi:hypothetical protein
MADNREFEYEGLHVSLSFDPVTLNVKRRVSKSGNELYQDELHFDKSLVGNFDLVSAEEQEKIAIAWGTAGLKSWIEDGKFDAIK